MEMTECITFLNNSNLKPCRPNTEGGGERHWGTVSTWSMGICWEKYALNLKLGEKKCEQI